MSAIDPADPPPGPPADVVARRVQGPARAPPPRVRAAPHARRSAGGRAPGVGGTGRRVRRASRSCAIRSGPRPGCDGGSSSGHASAATVPPTPASCSELGADGAAVEAMAGLDRLERAALIASGVERLDRRDVATIVGRDAIGAGSAAAQGARAVRAGPRGDGDGCAWPRDRSRPRCTPSPGGRCDDRPPRRLRGLAAARSARGAAARRGAARLRLPRLPPRRGGARRPDADRPRPGRDAAAAGRRARRAPAGGFLQAAAGHGDGPAGHRCRDRGRWSALRRAAPNRRRQR